MGLERTFCGRQERVARGAREGKGMGVAAMGLTLALTVALLATSLAVAAPAAPPLPAAITFGTSSVGSTFYVLAVGMADLVARETGIAASAEPVGGSDANVRALAARRVEVAILNALSASNGYLGRAPFSTPVPVRLIAQGDASLRQMVVRAASGIRSPLDLRGKRIIGRRPALPEIEAVLHAVLETYGLPADSVRVLQTAETNEAIEAIRLGSVDGAIIPGGVGAGFLVELALTTDVRFIDFSERMEALLDRLGPAFFPATIPANTYRGQSQAVVVPALKTVLVTRADLPEELVYRITRAIMGNYEAVARLHQVGRAWTVANSLESPPIPFHEGAVRYYREIGAWNPTVQRAQERLLALSRR